MTEPVAYWHIPQIENEEIFVDFSPSKSLNFENIPLYTAEQLQPRVKMTKKQYHSFKLWKYHTAGWNMTNCAEWARDEQLKSSQAMQAWLHPETIKIVDE